ncbi:MAG: segregation and condensation protein [Frankiales bacterium]|nr:segregation and condensation protein [Frankiales bacterium]
MTSGDTAPEGGPVEAVVGEPAALDGLESAPGEAREAAVPDLPLATMLESLLLVADEPVTDILLAELAGSPQDAVVAELTRLAQEYTDTGRGFDLRQVAGGWRLYTRSECAGLVERFVLRGQTARMTQAALETLAVVAYRQPVTRGRVAAVRGVNVDGVMRTLLSRGLIAERGSDPESSATLYGTTELFLERLGLRALEELPSLAPLLPDLESLEYGQDSIST